MKIKLILKLYDALICGGVLRKSFCNENGITERTFYRYINEISGYLQEFKRDYYISVIDYEGAYCLKKCNSPDR